MAIQLGNFTPLQFRHYQLAETQDEKDADNERKLNQIALQGANAIASAREHTAGALAVQKGQLAEHGRQANMNADIHQQQIDATVAQQGVANDIAQQRIDQDNRRFDATLAQQGISNELNQRQDARAQAASERQAADQQRQDEEYKQAQELKQIPIAMAKFGHYLTTAEPDKNGMVDVTDQKDNIKTMVGGFGDQDYKRITAQNVNGKTQLFGYSDDNKAMPLTRNGNQVSIDNKVLQTQSMFYGGNDTKTAKAQAELEKAQLENEKTRKELETVGQLTTQQKIGMANELYPVDPMGRNTDKVSENRQNFIKFLAANPNASITEAMGGAIKPAQTAIQTKQSQLPPGTKRVINGTPAVWDGKGWKRDSN